MKSITNRPDFTKRTLSLGKVPCYQYCKSLKDELKDGMTQDDAVLCIARCSISGLLSR